MGNQKYKVRLSPQLRLGVKSKYFDNNLFKYTGFLFLVVSAALGTWTVYVVSTSDSAPVAVVSEAPQPQVLGASDTAGSAVDDPRSAEENAFIEYTAVKGDTIFNIAQTHGVDWTMLATINNIDSPFTIRTGQKFKIPSPNQ